jgi:hypothetical protein
MLSALMMVPRNSSASASANADLPLAVGPATMISEGAGEAMVRFYHGVCIIVELREQG